MIETLTNNENIRYSEQSCCGKSFNTTNTEIVNLIYVDDDYIKKEALTWLQKNIKKYKFVGKEAKILRKELINSSNNILYSEQIEKYIATFFELFANNPFCVENGLNITEKSYIIGKNLECYFVMYHEGLFIPFGCLERFIHNKIESVQAEYLKNAKDFALEVIKETSLTTSDIDNNLQKTKKEDVATYFRFAMASITFVLSVIYIIYCIINVDWKNLGYIVEHSANLYHIIGFACEKGFVIGHNCILNHVLIGMAFVWLIYILLTNVKVIKEYKNAQNYEKLRAVEKAITIVKENIPKIEENIAQADALIKDNNATLKNIFIKSHWYEKKFGPKILKLNNNRDLVYSDTMNPILPKTIYIFLLLVLVISTIFVGCKSTNDDFKVGFRDSIKNMQYNANVSTLKSQSKFVTVNEGDVYTKGYPESLILYHIPANTKCDVIDDESNELYSKISFLTEYGFVKGWISKDLIATYNPYYDVTLKRAQPIECFASSELDGKKYYGASNAADGRYGTSWQEGIDGNGYGEWISFSYGEIKGISSIGIYNGNGGSEELYYANVRPIDINIYFYNDDVQVGKTSYTLQDGIQGMQYFVLNKTIEADSMRIEIDSVSEGTEYQDACIAEIEVYYTDVHPTTESET